ncbi:MAG: O-antigen ligase family protein [Flavobacteriaceae bacterium]|nr:O-antigen ligase family protein [Flavobacteriaceae bacterium]
MIKAVKTLFVEKSMNYFLVLALISFAFIMNISQKLSTLLLVTSFGLALLNYKHFYRKNLLKGMFLILVFIVYMLAYYFVGNEFEIKTIEKRVSLIALPIIFSLVTIDSNAFYNICLYFVYGVILAAVFNYIEPFINDFDWNTFQFIEIKEKIVFQKHNWMNHFYSLEFSNFLDRSYYGIYACLAIAIVWFMLKWKMKYKLLAIFFLLINIFLSNSLIGILGLGILLFFIVLKMKKPILFLGFPLLFIGVMMISPRFNKYVVEIWTYANNIDAVPKDFLRFRWAMWESTVELIKEQPVSGYGKEGFDKALKAKLHVNVGWSYQILDNVAFNAHNQFLQIFGETGIFGFLAYSCTFLAFLYCLIKQKCKQKYLKYCFIALIFAFSLSESLLDRYAGISFLSFFYCFFVMNRMTSLK